MSGTATHRQHCNVCGRDTNHVELVHNETSETQVYDEEQGWAVEWRTRRSIVRCSGCDGVSFRYAVTENGDVEATFVRLYPPVALRRRPAWLEKLPPDVNRLLRQTYHALDAGHRALAVMGARAVADVLLQEKVGDVGGFKDKLKQMQTAGYISAMNADVLDAALEAGNAAAHRGHEPTAEDLDAVMDIIENLLQAVYHLSGLAGRLRAATPKRSPKPPAPPNP